MHAPTSSPPPRPRVLVASRDQVFARSLKASLESKGADVQLWEGAAAARADGAQLEGVDVLLIETHGLGEADASVVERVREHSPLIEIVAISEDPPVESAVQALRSGIYTLLAYPVSDDQILDAIRAATSRKRRGEERIRALETSPTTSDSPRRR
jgi:DNA-binding NtrC family response regulator